MAKYLVTGGCGFIGSHLVDALSTAGHDLRVLDDLSTGRCDNVGAAVEVIVGSIVDPAVVADVMSDVDGCFHLAAVASVDRCNEAWAETHRINLTGTINIFDAARRGDDQGIPVVYASSAAIYGDNQNLPLAETEPPLPMSAYGADKLGCEQHGRVATGVHGVPTLGLRFFNVFGPRQDPRSPYSGVISIFANKALAGEALCVHGDGRQVRDFIYVGDVVRHLLSGMATLQTSDGTAIDTALNVCTGQGTTLLDLIEALGAAMGGRPEVAHGPERAGDIRASIGNPERATSVLGLTAETAFADGITRTLEWMRHD